VLAGDILAQRCCALGHRPFSPGPFLGGLLLGQFKALRRPPLVCSNAGGQPCLGELATVRGGEDAGDSTTTSVHLAQAAAVSEEQDTAAYVDLGRDIDLGSPVSH
jgi:hypothetical protein